MAELTAKQVADYFLSLVDEDCGDSITNLKIQKLLYYAQGFHLAIFDEPLFDEPIVGWKYGPVIESLYHEYKCAVTCPLPKPENIDFSIYSNDVTELLSDIYEIYGQFSAWKLAELTHEEDPWKNTEQNQVIDNSLIKSYFKNNLLNTNG